MAPRPESRVLKPAAGIRAPEAALFYAQLGVLSARMFADLEGFTTADLEFQVRPGTNTVGMLLLHLAGAEAHWMLTATTGTGEEALRRTLGIGPDDDGMPVGPRGGHPAGLRGWTLADYRRVHDRARRFTRRCLAGLSAADIGRGRPRRRWDGRIQVINVRWIFLQLLQHQPNHHGQMLLIRNALREKQPRRR
jgi:hypothetical protein